MKSPARPLFMTGMLSNLDPHVAYAVENNYWFHRGAWMESILKDIFKFFDASLKNNYTTLALAATGLGGAEALVSNLVVPGNQVWVSSKNAFATIADRWGAMVTIWNGENIPKKALAPDIIFIDAVSLDGARGNLQKITTRARASFPKAILIVDLSISFGADPIEIKKIDADGYLFIPEQALGGIPGIAFVSLCPKVFEHIRTLRAHMQEIPFALDLLKHESVRSQYSTPFSPDISALVGLQASLEVIKKNGGISPHISRHAYWAQTIRKYLARYGFKTIVPSSQQSNAFTVFTCPKTCDTKKLVADLEQQSIIISTVAGNPDQIKIGHVGYLPFQNLASFLTAWQQVASGHLGVSFPVPRVKSDTPFITPSARFPSMSKTILAPGPTKYCPEVFQVTKDYYHPGTREGSMRIHEAKESLKMWLNNGNDPIILSTPSTGFLEASIVNLTSTDDRGLIISHGKFGERFKNIARAHQRTVDTLEIPDKKWGNAFSPEHITSFLKKDLRAIKKSNGKKISFVCFQQTETSSGVSYHMPHLIQIVRALRKYNPTLLIIMDGVSGVAVHDLDFKKIDVDVVILGSQKGIGISSGIAYAMLSNRAITHMLRSAGYKKSFKYFTHDRTQNYYIEIFEKTQRVHYFSFLRMLTLSPQSTPYPMESVFHILSTIASLRLMKQQGGKKFITAGCRHMASYLRRESKKMGLRVLARAPYQSNSVTALLLPVSVSVSDLRKKLENEYGIYIVGAQSDYWKQRMIRIGHMGYITKNDIKRCLAAIHTILSV